MNNKRYKITLNWYNEIHEIWTHADSIFQAKTFALKKFAKEIGWESRSISSYFDGETNNIKIEEA